MASSKLTRTNGTATNGQKMTFSVWFKIGTSTNQQSLISSVTGSGAATDLKIMASATHNNVFRFECITVEGSTIDLKLNRSLRDPGAFYNIIIAVDTTQATDTNRVKIYINGVQETSFATATYPTQNHTLDFSKTGITQQVGAYSNSNYWDGLMSYFTFVDGTAYDQSYFGEVDSSSGIWTIKTAPSVTYGNNGFLLKMDTSSPGTDTSGNSNTFTASGTPTLTQDNASNNFITLNPLNAYYTNSTFSNGNTTFASGASYSGTTANILLDTGKWYWEVKVISKDGDTDNYSIGIQGQEATGTNQYVGGQLFGYQYYGTSGQLYNNNSAASYGNTYTAGDIIGVALDCTNNKLYFSKNGTFQNSGNPSTGSNGLSITAPASVTLGGYYPSQTFWSGSSGTFSMNFGNGFFGTTAVASSNADAAGYGLMEYAVPTGFYTLNTKNLNTYG